MLIKLSILAVAVSASTPALSAAPAAEFLNIPIGATEALARVRLRAAGYNDLNGIYSTCGRGTSGDFITFLAKRPNKAVSRDDVTCFTTFKKSRDEGADVTYLSSPNGRVVAAISHNYRSPETLEQAFAAQEKLHGRGTRLPDEPKGIYWFADAKRRDAAPWHGFEQNGSYFERFSGGSDMADAVAGQVQAAVDALRAQK